MELAGVSVKPYGYLGFVSISKPLLIKDCLAIRGIEPFGYLLIVWRDSLTGFV